MQSHFVELVKHDMKFRNQGRAKLPKQWVWTYAAVIAIGLIVVATVEITEGRIQINDNVWYVLIAIPFAALGMSIGLTKLEWKNSTYGWWLSLPYSRLTLMTCKFVAVLVRIVLVFAGLYCIISLLAIYSLLLTHSFDANVVGHFLLRGIQWGLILLAICPLTASFGALFAVLGESKLRPVMPLTWFIWGGLWWLWISRFEPHIGHRIANGLITSNMIVPIACFIIASWIVAYLFIRLSAYVLDKHLNV